MRFKAKKKCLTCLLREKEKLPQYRDFIWSPRRRPVLVCVCVYVCFSGCCLLVFFNSGRDVTVIDTSAGRGLTAPVITSALYKTTFCSQATVLERCIVLFVRCWALLFSAVCWSCKCEVDLNVKMFLWQKGLVTTCDKPNYTMFWWFPNHPENGDSTDKTDLHTHTPVTTASTVIISLVANKGF